MHLCALYFLSDKLRMKAQDMYIHLNGLKLYAYHGVLPQENRIGAEYTLNLRLKTDFSHAAENDCWKEQSTMLKYSRLSRKK